MRNVKHGLSKCLYCVMEARCQKPVVWIIQICRDFVQAPVLSWHGSLFVRAPFLGQETICTKALAKIQTELLVNLSRSFGPELPVGGNCQGSMLENVAYVFPSNEGSVISQIVCNIRMSFKVYCLCR